MKACIERTYVLPGDRLIVGRKYAGYRCALFGDTAGWIPEARIRALVSAAPPALKDWQGSWHDGDNTLTFTVAGTALKVEGDAYWPANLLPEDLPNGPNLGPVEAQATPSGREVHFSEGSESSSCRLHAVLLGRFLRVDDHGNCGGMNVRFDGIYCR